MTGKAAVTGPQQPHEQVLAGLAVAWGVVWLSTLAPPGEVSQAMPGWLAALCAVTIAASGALVLAGTWWRGGVVTGLQVERAGLLLCTGSLWAIGGALAVAGGPRTAVPLGLIGAWAVANMVRARQIRGQVKAIAVLMRESE